MTEIRLATVDDAEALATHLARDRDTIDRWNPAQPDAFFTTAGQIERAERLLGEYEQGRVWPGVVLAEGVVAGQVIVSGILREPFLKGSVGYWIGSSHGGQGHATRAVAQVLTVMRGLGLHRAEAGTQPDHLASQKILRANGFTSYGIAHSCILVDGAWHDDLMWELTLS